MIERYSTFFEQLTPDFKSSDFELVFAPDAFFADPFQQVHGVQGIIRVFRHMYKTLEHPRFEVIETMEHNLSGFIRWRFYYNDRMFEGVSHVRFNPEGKVVSHIDYWDAASAVYETLPVLGSILRWIKKRLSIS